MDISFVFGVYTNSRAEDVQFRLKQNTATVRGLLCRRQSLRIRQTASDVVVHPERDPGCLLKAHDLLRPFHTRYSYALVMFDREGCGREDQTRQSLEQQVGERLSRSGWGDRAEVIVLDPELDIWVWSDSPRVDAVLGWDGRTPRLRDWLVQKGFLDSPEARKPARPKEALEAALKEVRTPRSAAVYQQLAEQVSLHRCEDPAFAKLRDVLRDWFGTG